ncbi:MAG: hypothetical protein ACKVWV_20110 [Planctomycetota bacterium]
MTDSGFGFERNENVVVVADAPAKYRPSTTAWAISWRVVENERHARAAGQTVGTRLVLVEHGSDAEVPVELLHHR